MQHRDKRRCGGWLVLQECSMPVDSVLPNDRLDTMGGKVTFIQQAVKQLATVRKQHLAAAAEQGASKGAA